MYVYIVNAYQIRNLPDLIIYTEISGSRTPCCATLHMLQTHHDRLTPSIP